MRQLLINLCYALKRIMSNQSETKRSYKRWNLNLKDNYEPESVQLGGVGVQLLRRCFIDISLCHGVAKDISVGGVGLLVPAEKTIPNKIIVVFDKTNRLAGKVMYRRAVSEKLMFLGVEWISKNERLRSDIVNRLQLQAQLKKAKKTSIS